MTAISAIVNLHREGLSARPSIESAVRAISTAQREGLAIELVLILDRPDQATRDIARTTIDCGHGRVVETDYGDLSSARNRGVFESRGDFVAFLDADDLWCAEWLAEAHRVAHQERLPAVVFHPQWNVMFGTRRFLFEHPDQTDPRVSLDSLRSVNYWTSLSFARREIYEQFPYRVNRIDEGFGFEDWAWHCETIEAGIVHRTVPGTTHFIRSKPNDSLRDRTLAGGCLRTPTDLFVFPDRRSREPAAAL